MANRTTHYSGVFVLICLICVVTFLAGSVDAAAQLPPYDDNRQQEPLTRLIDSGLVAYYPFNGNANDASGRGNHGTVSGAVLTEDRLGRANNAYKFDGVDDHILIPDSNSLCDRLHDAHR